MTPLYTEELTPPKCTFSVLRIDNGTRVRDGYNRLSTRGQTRTSATQSDMPICRKNVPANALVWTPVPPRNGKEGVNGSSPLEGFSEAPAQQLLSLSVEATLWSGGVHETSTAPNVSELTMLQPLSPSGLAGSAATST
jgi:hypothetical protein